MKKYLLTGIIALLLIGMASAECEFDIKNTNDLLAKISEINSKLSECGSQIPPPADRLFGDVTVNIQIIREDGSKEDIMIITEDGVMKTIEKGYSEDPDYVATIADCALDNALASNNPASAFAYLYSNKHLTIGPHGFLNNLKFRFVMIFAKGSIKSIGTEVPTTCSNNKGKVGEVCDHGGECETGNCIYVSGQGAERTYKCSCDPFKYVGGDMDGNCN